MEKNKGRSRFIVLCVAPAVILFVIFMIIPTLNVFRMSLFERGAYSPDETFVGFANFKSLVNDSNFIRVDAEHDSAHRGRHHGNLRAWRWSLRASSPARRSRARSFFRVIFYIPNILSVVVISGIFSAIYKPENGMLNSLLSHCSARHDGPDPVEGREPGHAQPHHRHGLAGHRLLHGHVHGLHGQPCRESLYESASLDGAGRVTQFFQITIPLIWTNIRTTLTFFIISTINMAFLFVKAMTSGGPNGASEVALSYMYGQKDAGLYGYSMAIGVVVFLFSFAPVRPGEQGHQARRRWNSKGGRDMDERRKSRMGERTLYKIFIYVVLIASGRQHPGARGLGVHGLHQAEQRVLRQPLVPAPGLLLAELRGRLERRPRWATTCSTP